MGNTRSYVHAFVLYPDNEKQMQLFDWLKQHFLSCKVMYILHDPETDEKKPHYHVMICYETLRTANGVRKSFGVDRVVWRLAHMSLDEEVSMKLVKDENAVTETGYVRVEKWKDKEVFVLSNPDDPLSYIESEYLEGQKVCSVECKDDEVWRLTPVYVVPHVECVSDRCSYGAYMLHDTFECQLAGKKKYERSALHGDRDFIESCFPVPKKQCLTNLINDAILIAKDCSGTRHFMQMCLIFGRSDIIEYTASHSYFIERFVVPYFNEKGGAKNAQ